jgi:hypothetical protein
MPAAPWPAPLNQPCPVAARASGNTLATAAYPPGMATHWKQASATPRTTITIGDGTKP